MLRIALFAACALAVLANRAEAGAQCMTDEELDELADKLELRTKKPDTSIDYLQMCIPAATSGELATKKRLARINAACTKVLTANPADQDCILLAGYQHKAELGGVVIFDAIVAWNAGPWSPRLAADYAFDLELFKELKDPRAVEIVKTRWRTFASEAAEREKQKRGKSLAMAQWSGWRRQAATVLGALGTEADIAFLDEQAKMTKDRFVKKACTDAIAAIGKRAK